MTHPLGHIDEGQVAAPVLRRRRRGGLDITGCPRQCGNKPPINANPRQRLRAYISLSLCSLLSCFSVYLQDDDARATKLAAGFKRAFAKLGWVSASLHMSFSR